MLSDGTASLLFDKIPPRLQARFKSNHHAWLSGHSHTKLRVAMGEATTRNRNVFTLMLASPSLVISENKNSSPEAVVGQP